MRWITVLTGFGLALAAGTAAAGFGELNMPVGVTPISREAYFLHMLILWICVIIGIIVFGVMFWSILRHRKSIGHKAAKFHHSTMAEIVWTAIPFFILVGFAIPATKGLIVMEDTTAADLTLKVTGYQWMWKYEYLDDDIDFLSSLAPSSRAAMYQDPSDTENYLLEVDNEVVLPIDRKVRILLTSNDVIHAWWVPAFGMKKDAIPGFINELWLRIEEPGVYRGQCAELCGAFHGYMPIVVRAEPWEAYQAWVEEQKALKTAARDASRDPGAAPASAATRASTQTVVGYADASGDGEER